MRKSKYLSKVLSKKNLMACTHAWYNVIMGYNVITKINLLRFSYIKSN